MTKFPPNTSVQILRFKKEEVFGKIIKIVNDQYYIEYFQNTKTLHGYFKESELKSCVASKIDEYIFSEEKKVEICCLGCKTKMMSYITENHPCYCYNCGKRVR